MAAPAEMIIADAEQRRRTDLETEFGTVDERNKLDLIEQSFPML